ncbi:MAG: hypothetical protein AAB600_05590 [Patescibacteria group bacterium]
MEFIQRALSTQSTVTTSIVSISNKQINVNSDEVHNAAVPILQDHFEIGNFVDKNLPEERLALIDGKFYKISDQSNQDEGFTSNSGIFNTP